MASFRILFHVCLLLLVNTTLQTNVNDIPFEDPNEAAPAIFLDVVSAIGSSFGALSTSSMTDAEKVDLIINRSLAPIEQRIRSMNDPENSEEVVQNLRRIFAEVANFFVKTNKNVESDNTGPTVPLPGSETGQALTMMVNNIKGLMGLLNETQNIINSVNDLFLPTKDDNLTPTNNGVQPNVNLKNFQPSSFDLPNSQSLVGTTPSPQKQTTNFQGSELLKPSSQGNNEIAPSSLPSTPSVSGFDSNSLGEIFSIANLFINSLGSIDPLPESPALETTPAKKPTNKAVQPNVSLKNSQPSSFNLPNPQSLVGTTPSPQKQTTNFQGSELSKPSSQGNTPSIGGLDANSLGNIFSIASTFINSIGSIDPLPESQALEATTTKKPVLNLTRVNPSFDPLNFIDRSVNQQKLKNPSPSILDLISPSNNEPGITLSNNDKPKPTQLASNQPKPTQLANNQPKPTQLAINQPKPSLPISNEPKPDFSISNELKPTLSISNQPSTTLSNNNQNTPVLSTNNGAQSSLSNNNLLQTNQQQPLLSSNNQPQSFSSGNPQPPTFTSTVNQQVNNQPQTQVNQIRPQSTFSPIPQNRPQSNIQFNERFQTQQPAVFRTQSILPFNNNRHPSSITNLPNVRITRLHVVPYDPNDLGNLRSNNRFNSLTSIPNVNLRTNNRFIQNPTSRPQFLPQVNNQPQFNQRQPQFVQQAIIRPEFSQVNNRPQTIQPISRPQIINRPQLNQPTNLPQLSQPQTARRPQLNQPTSTPQVSQPQTISRHLLSQPNPIRTPQLSQPTSTPQVSQPQTKSKTQLSRPIVASQVSQPQSISRPQLSQANNKPASGIPLGSILNPNRPTSGTPSSTKSEVPLGSILNPIVTTPRTRPSTSSEVPLGSILNPIKTTPRPSNLGPHKPATISPRVPNRSAQPVPHFSLKGLVDGVNNIIEGSKRTVNFVNTVVQNSGEIPETEVLSKEIIS